MYPAKSAKLSDHLEISSLNDGAAPNEIGAL